jgi:16S rRNA (cytosine1402-N4)-methyltransferase
MNDPFSGKHVPVMRGPAVELLGCHAGGVYVDGTVGGGGYAEAVLEASAPDGMVLALDWDAQAIERARERLKSYQERLILEAASFSDLPRILSKWSLGPVDGVVIDLGVSSFQLDDPMRGFSFLHDGPLDMRMDRNLDQTAADLVNSLPEEELARIIFQFGEEKWSRRIARAIVSRRKHERFSRTRELAGLIAGVAPKTKDSRRIHPATRTFQALRIAVNRELEVLQSFLAGALDVLKPGGRLCIVAFHSLEDRLVKEHFRAWASSCRCPREVIRCRCEGRPLVRLLTRKAIRPGLDELEMNPRARSGRLRALEKLGDQG